MKTSFISPFLASALCVLPDLVHGVEFDEELQEMLTGEPETLPPIIFRSAQHSPSPASAYAGGFDGRSFEVHLKKDRTRLPHDVSAFWHGLNMIAPDGVDLEDVRFSGGPEDADSIICRFGYYDDALVSEWGEGPRMVRTENFAAGEVVSMKKVSMAYCEATWFEGDFLPAAGAQERQLPPARRT